MDQLLEQLLDHLRGIWRRRFFGLGVAWLVALAGIAVVFTIPSEYQASARLYVDTQSVLKPLMQRLAVQPNITQQISVLSRTLLSRPNMEKVVRMADMDADAHSPDQREALIARVTSAVKLTGTPRENLYSIVYRDHDPAQAKRVVESILTIFVESGLGNKRRDTENAKQFLHTQIAEYESKLADAERRLKEFKLKNLGALGAAEDSIANMLALSAEINQARTEQRAAEEARDALRRQLEGEEPVFLPDPSMLSATQPGGENGVTDVDPRLDALRRGLDDLLRRYTERHPDVAGTRRIIADLEKEREARLEERRRALEQSGQKATVSNADRNPVYQQLKIALADAEAKAAAMRARVSELQRRHEQMETTARMKPEIEEQLGQLNREYSVHKKNYQGLVASRESAILTGELDQTAVADFKIVEPPRVQSTPVAPNRRMLLGLVIALSLSAGVAASFVASQVLPTFSTTKSLQQVAQRPVLGVVSFQNTAIENRVRRQRGLAFAGAMGGLFAVYGCALIMLAFTGGA